MCTRVTWIKGVIAGTWPPVGDPPPFNLSFPGALPRRRWQDGRPEAENVAGTKG